MYSRIPVLIPLIFLVSIIPSGIVLTSTNNYFGATNFAYGQTNQTNTNNESLATSHPTSNSKLYNTTALANKGAFVLALLNQIILNMGNRTSYFLK